MQLFIGNKNYSSWSLRAWLMLAKSGIDFNEVQLVLDTPEFYQRLESVTPTLKVPTLVDDSMVVWDSLAICEYINDAYSLGKYWPTNTAQRAKARAIACEMHSGFNGVRNEMPMNIRAKRSVVLSEQAKQDIARIEQIWSEQYNEYAAQGGWLFGQWSIADAMFAPVVLRFKTYGITVNSAATNYMEQVLNCPVLQRWVEEALMETDIVAIDEAGEERE
ncbi:glutathione S-transferase family protein [Pseudoalteromonas sp. MMG013]|uniref:glutathione S-transferase family protein n=1 Tax=Pseudoalteromonas sp. MMG013 TaxID=2822687 RepID=UPI001B396726|nr:glutathione S-transferase family protein [Pseudoalteromonas sp. MMG013]MBQ4863290.1 glutathione S-transferase family protein [Pseudoalteromonas sp. MMG013]